MTCVEFAYADEKPPLKAGYAFESISQAVERFMPERRDTFWLEPVGPLASSDRTPLEQRLSEVQEAISRFSMHLPAGFAHGLSRQFANMMDEETWEPEDDLIDLGAVNTFLIMLHHAQPARRPGLGTNGQGSLSAFWRASNGRLTVTCHPSGGIAWVLTYTAGDEGKERAAGNCGPSRLREVLAPYEPGTWFDQ